MVALRSPASAWISLTAAGGAFGGEVLRDRDGGFDRAHRFVGDAFAGDAGADVVPGQAEHRADELDDALEVELGREVQARLDRCAEEPGDDAGLEVVGDVRDEEVQARADRFHEVAEEPDRVLDDLHDRGGGLGEDAQEQVLQLVDRFDGADDGVLRLVDQALVGLLELFDLLVDLVERGGVFLGEVLDQLFRFLVDGGFQVVELAREVLRRFLTELLQVGGESVHLRLQLRAALGDAGLRLAEFGADDVGHLGDDRLHLRDVELAGLLVEVVRGFRQAG